MARKRKHEEHENHERWLVSYADFITLLFAFFVVMYSISSVNEGKYRVLSSSLVSAFSEPKQSMSPIRYGEDLQAPIIQHQVMQEDSDVVPRIGVDHQIVPTTREIAEMQKLADDLEAKLKKLVDADLVNIHKTNKGVEIEIKSNVLFGSGQAVIQSSAIYALKLIADILVTLNNPVNVEGFTDNIPIKTLLFPSNWELSAARAANVVNLFSTVGVKPERLSAIGYGEFRPQASNDTPEGRVQNRRINIVVLNRDEVQRQRIAALNKPEPAPTTETDAKKMDPIGESIRRAMTLSAINKTTKNADNKRMDELAAPPATEVKPTARPSTREGNTGEPNMKPVSPRLKPPTLLPLGKPKGPSP